MTSRTPSRSGRSLLPVLLAVLGALAVVAAVWWIAFRGPSKPSVDEGRQATAAFLGDLKSGRAAEAWQSTTSDFKSMQGKETFTKLVKSKPLLKGDFEFISTQTVEVGDSPREEYVYRAKDPAAKNATVRLLLDHQDGTWRVDRLVVP